MASEKNSYVALLRAINLGKSRRVAMSDFRSALEAMGLEDVTTVVQSGNAVFRSPRIATEILERELEAGLGERLAMPIEVIVRTAAELQEVIDRNPFPHYADEGSKLSVTFLRRPSTAEEREAVGSLDLRPDEVALVDRSLYLWAPEGATRSRSAAFRWDKVIEPSLATNRNWNTIVKLHALAIRGGFPPEADLDPGRN